MINFTLPGWFAAVIGFAAMHALAAAAVPSDQRRWAVFPAVFLLAELLRWSWPFGGVPLATVAMAQVSGPLAITARLGGAVLLTGLTALAGSCLAALMAGRTRSALMGITAIAATAVTAAHAPVSTPMAKPPYPATPGNSEAHATDTGRHVPAIQPDPGESGEPSVQPPHTSVAAAGGDHEPRTVRVAAIQGGGPQNTRADACSFREVFERHLRLTRMQVEESADLIIWPENAVHLSHDLAVAPTRCEDRRLLKAGEARSLLSELAREKSAVLLAGMFETAPDGESNINYAVVYDASGEVVDTYRKHRLAPFGEYVPLRGWIERFSDDLPRLDVTPGPAGEPAVVQTPLGAMGVAICWEVFFGHHARNAVAEGSRLLLSPTNGSSYWLTSVQSQQTSASRLRAIETDRWVVQAATTGFSAVIRPDGEVVERSGISEGRVLTADVELRSGATLAVRLGSWPATLAAVLTILLSHRAGSTLPWGALKTWIELRRSDREASAETAEAAASD